MLNEQLQVGQGIKTDIKMDANKMNEDILGSSSELGSKITQGYERSGKIVSDATIKAATMESRAIRNSDAIDRDALEKKIIVDNQYGGPQVKNYRDYTAKTVDDLFEEKKQNLDDKAENYYDAKTNKINNDLLGKGTEAEEYRLNKTKEVNNILIEYSKKAADGVASTKIEAMEAQLKAEEEKGLAQMEIRKWRFYRKIYKGFMLANKIFWPLLGIGLGVAAAYIVLVATGYLL